MKRLYVLNPHSCTGCYTCEMMCSFHFEGEFNPAKARINIIKDLIRGVSVPSICRHCSNPPCYSVCKVEAMSIDPVTGAIVVDEERCTGCGDCARACPYGAIALHPDTGIAMKCDLCGGDPECVRHCPRGVIIFAEISEISSKTRKDSEERLIQEVLQARSHKGGAR